MIPPTLSGTLASGNQAVEITPFAPIPHADRDRLISVALEKVRTARLMRDLVASVVERQKYVAIKREQVRLRDVAHVTGE